MPARSPLHLYHFMCAEYPWVRQTGFRFPEHSAEPIGEEVSFAAFVIAKAYLESTPPPDNTSTLDVAIAAGRSYPSVQLGDGAVILAAYALGYVIYPNLDGSGVLAFPKDANANH